MATFPCIVNKRYISFPCKDCTATTCWTGKKPQPAPPPLAEGQIYCRREDCQRPFHPQRTRSRYCSENCRYQAMMRRRRIRRLGDV